MVKLENVSKSFLINNTESLVIDNINISILPKEIFGLVGNTGSGKSTILRLINGFITPNSGNIYLMEKKINLKNKHDFVKNTSMIFQNFNLLKNLSVIENVLLPATIRKDNKKISIERARQLLNFVGLSNIEKSYINTLSGGEKQRIAIARSLMTNPNLILCDEPTSALDGKMSFEVLKLLKEINREFGTTIIIVSHDISVIKAICNRVAILEDGKVSDIIRLQPKEIYSLSYKEAFLND